MRGTSQIRNDWTELFKADRARWDEALAIYNDRIGDRKKEPWRVVEGVLVDIGYYDPVRTGAEMAAEEYEQAMAAQDLLEGR